MCWDNLNKIKLTEQGNFSINGDIYIEKEACKYCGNTFLALKYRKQEYCCKSCGKIGKPRDEQIKAKISKTHIERGLSKGENNPMFGKKSSEAHCRNMSKALKGKYAGKKAYWYNKPVSKEIRNKISASKKGKLCGPENSNWKGGISCEPYCFEWTFKAFKEMIKERDGNKCLNPDCRKTTELLVVHHIDYDKKNCGRANLITLCVSCNSRANIDRKWHKAWYSVIIQNRYKEKEYE